MKTLTTLLALAILSATASAQTIKALGYDTASGEVVANTGTNKLRFTNAVAFNSAPDFLTINGATISASSGLGEFIFDEARFAIANDSVWDWANSDFRLFVPLVFENTQDAATTRSNLSLGLPALTETSNVTMMRALAGSTNTNAPFSGVLTVLDLGAFDDTVQVTISNGIIISIVP
jgi:hypothetical protein